MRREVGIAEIDVRWLDRNSHFATFVDVLHDFVGAARLRGQQRGHELHGVVRLEISGLECEKRIRSGVRLVEAVSGKLLHQVEDFYDLLLREASLDRAFYETVALLGHFLRILLAHGAAQKISFAE